MNSRRLSKGVNSNIGIHCQTLVDDFFNFVDGKLDQVKVITEFRDISEPMPPQIEQMRKMLARCDKVWKEYCDFMRIPRESKQLFINRVKTRWIAIGKQQMPRIQKRKRSAAR